MNYICVVSSSVLLCLGDHLAGGLMPSVAPPYIYPSAYQPRWCAGTEWFTRLQVFARPARHALLECIIGMPGRTARAFFRPTGLHGKFMAEQRAGLAWRLLTLQGAGPAAWLRVTEAGEAPITGRDHYEIKGGFCHAFMPDIWQTRCRAAQLC